MAGYPAYAEYKDSGIEWLGEIPADWTVIPLKFALAMPITDGPHEPPTLQDEGIPFISAESIKNDRIDFDRKRGFISVEEHVRFSKKYKPQYGDVYMVKSGATTGNVARVTTKVEFNIWSPLAALRPDKSIATTDFIFYLMKSRPFFHSVALRWSFGTQQNIGMDVISNIRIALPPLSEQQAIARFLNHKTVQIDALIAKKETLLAKLAAKRTALVSHAVTKGLDPTVSMKDSCIEWLGEIPAHWEAKRLKFLISEPLKYGANEVAELDDPDFPRYIRITDVRSDGTLRNETFRSLPPHVAYNYLLDEGDILLARSGATVGKTFIYRKSWGIAAYAGYLIRARVSMKMDADFIYHFLQSTLYWEWLNSIFIQSTIQNVSAEKYANLWLPVPTIEEQQAISRHLDEQTAKLNRQKAKIEQAITRLKEYRIALITYAVTGKIDVRNVPIPIPIPSEAPDAP